MLKIPPALFSSGSEADLPGYNAFGQDTARETAVLPLGCIVWTGGILGMHHIQVLP